MSHPPLRIFGVPFSVHTRKVIVTARIKGIPFEVVPVAPIDPGSLPPDWRSISPTGLVPAIDDGGRVLSDSTAIVLYLEHVHPEPALLPREPAGYGRALALDAWAGSELFRAIVHPLFHQQIVASLRKVEPDREAIRRALEVAMPPALAHLEKLAAADFLVGGELSIADLAVMSNLVMLAYLGHPIDAGRFPALATYFRRHAGAGALAEALAVERPMVERMGLATTAFS
jgi:glutathione S-transferase